MIKHEKKKFKKVIEYNYGIEAKASRAIDIWSIVGFAIIPFWVYVLFRYDDLQFALIFVLWILSIFIIIPIIIYKNRQVLYEEV